MSTIKDSPAYKKLEAHLNNLYYTDEGIANVPPKDIAILTIENSLLLVSICTHIAQLQRIEGF